MMNGDGVQNETRSKTSDGCNNNWGSSEIVI